MERAEVSSLGAGPRSWTAGERVLGEVGAGSDDEESCRGRVGVMGRQEQR